MMRTRSRHRATARSRFTESSQNPPSAASDSVISTIALTATRPARRRSRSASPIRNPSTRSALVLHEPPALERERPSPERLREVRLVRREHDRRATGPDVAQRAQDLVLHRLVEVARRLVGEEERGLAHDRAGERRALSLALRELRGVGLRAGREADDAERVEDALGDLALGRPQHAEDEGDVLVDGADREELRVLEDDADRAPERGHVAVLERPEVVSEHLDVAVGGQIITVEEPQQRRLARPGGSGEDDELPLVDAKGDVAQRRDLHGPDRIDLRDAVKLNHRGHFDYSGPLQILESFSSRSRLTTAGLALPRVAFMTWPTRALAAAVLPRL